MWKDFLIIVVAILTLCALLPFVFVSIQTTILTMRLNRLDAIAGRLEDLMLGKEFGDREIAKIKEVVAIIDSHIYDKEDED